MTQVSAPSPHATPPPPPASTRTRPRLLLIVGVVVAVGVAVLVVAFTRQSGGQVTTSSTPQETAAPTASTVAPGATPEDAIAAFLRTTGVAYVGDCANAKLPGDVSAHCSLLHQDRGTTQVYATGPTFSEYDNWLLLAHDETGWRVIDTAPTGAVDAPKPPPW